MPDAPLVYVETNWIVSTFFRHRKEHKAANDLLDRAEQGKCEIRIPHAVLIEARHALDSDSNRVQNLVTQISDELATAFRYGEQALSAVVKALTAEPTNAYLSRKPDKHIDAIREKKGVCLIHDAATEVEELDRVRNRVRFRGADKFDLYILAAILVNRRKEPDYRPAIFFSENKREFQPKPDPSAKMPDTLYDEERIVYQYDYSFDSALVLWKKKYSNFN